MTSNQKDFDIKDLFKKNDNDNKDTQNVENYKTSKKEEKPSNEHLSEKGKGNNLE